MWIRREIGDYIRELLARRPCVMLSGARQTGKSSLLKRLFGDYRYVSLDLPQLAAEAQESGEYFLQTHGEPLFVDEIQYAPGLFRFLKLVIDEDRNRYARFLLSGSQKFALMADVSESLSGRISLLELHSLSIRELHSHFGGELSVSVLLDWMFAGGYPEVYAAGLEP